MRRLILIICFILSISFCCSERYKLNLPIFQANSNTNQINLTIYIDNEFNLHELKIIHDAFENWNNVSNKFINFDLIDNQSKPGKLEDYFWAQQYNYSIFIWHANSKNISNKFDNKYASYAGFWDLHGNIVIFSDRVDSNTNELHNVMVHEIGHMLGLKHISYEKSVMQPSSPNISDCITKNDSNRLCLIYGCVPKYECD